MQVVLKAGNKAGETVEMPFHVAKVLLEDGRAARVEDAPAPPPAPAPPAAAAVQAAPKKKKGRKS